MSPIVVSIINSIKSSKTKSNTTTFEKFSDGLKKLGHLPTQYKNKGVAFFSLTQFLNGRKKENVRLSTGLVLDYDGELDISEIEEWLFGWEYLMISSFSHRKDGVVDKIKVVIPYSEPCDRESWEKRLEGAKRYFRGCDLSSLTLTQFQAMPNCPKSRMKHAFIKYVKGERFNWRLIPIILDAPKQEQKCIDTTPSEFELVDSFRLSHEAIVYYKNGQVKASEIDSHIRDVYCPNHDDKEPSEFANVNDKGEPYIVCKKCGTIWVDSAPIKVSDNFSRLSNKIESVESILKPLKWQKIEKILESTFEQLTSRNVLYGFEGTGKSFLANIAQRKGKKVLFACNTNKQAVEKLESLSKLGLKTKLLTSKNYEIESRYGVKPVLYPKQHPWDSGRVNEAKTVQRIREANPNFDGVTIETVMSGYTFNTIDWELFDVVVTTHARLGHLGRLNVNSIKKGNSPVVPEEVIIFYDDPTINDFLTIAPFAYKMNKKSLFGETIVKHVPVKDNRDYYSKPNTIKLGYGFENNKVVFTTTELLIIELISKQYPDIKIHDKLLPENTKLEGGSVHLLSTKLVRSKYDGMLPALMERIKRHKFSFEYIANAQGCEINLNNNKGMNQFIGQSTVIEISIPPREETLLIYEQFNGEVSERTINLAIMLDKLHQAIGRNSGYRYKGNTCVVLIDPQYFKAVSENSRYHFNTIVKADGDHPEQYPRNKKEFPELVDAISWYINRHEVYLSDGKKFENDCIKALKAAPVTLRESRLKRMLTSIFTLRNDYSIHAKKLTALCALLLSKLDT